MISKDFFYKIEKNDIEKGKIITCGIDVGSVSTKAVICVDGKLYCYSITNTSSISYKSAENALKIIEINTGITINDCHYVVATGYGRVNVPFSNKTITEISCHSKGANYIGGDNIRTVLDIGGQDFKVIHIDEKGKVINFIMNDKCASGTGRSIEVIADILNIPLENVGPLSLEIDEEPEAITNTCVVFARSEALMLLNKGWSINKILASYLRAMAQRICTLVIRLTLKPDLLITGGGSKNIGLVKRIENILGIKSVKPNIDTQIAGALGASLIAKDLFEKYNLIHNHKNL